MYRSFCSTLMSIALFFSLVNAHDVEQSTCHHDEGNIFIILNKPLHRYLQARYSHKYETAKELLKHIHTLELIIQENTCFYSLFIKDLSSKSKIIIKGRERLLESIIGQGMIDNTIIKLFFCI